MNRFVANGGQRLREACEAAYQADLARGLRELEEAYRVRAAGAPLAMRAALWLRRRRDMARLRRRLQAETFGGNRVFLTAVVGHRARLTRAGPRARLGADRHS